MATRSTANQQYFATGNPANLVVNIGIRPNGTLGRYGTLGNYYSTIMVNVAGTTAPQQCQ
jgi:hypothetical protein